MIRLICFFEKWLGFFLKFFNPKRVVFERRNIWEPGATSFSIDGKRADLAVEFSSEGEFEQVGYLLEKLLENKKFLLEIIYCSPSAEKKVADFHLKYKEQVRYQRLVVYDRGKYDLKYWITASKLVLVRYDFFPQLLDLGRNMDEFVLLSCSTKSLQSKNMLIKKIYFSIYKLFSHIVCVSKADQNYLLENHVIQKENSSVADFRVNRIQDRISNANQKLQSTFRWWGNLKSFSSSYRQSLMLGNFWIDEIDSLSMDPLLNRVFKGELLIGITPHELSNDQLNKIKAWFQSKKIPVFEVSVADSDRDLKELFEQVQREKGVLLFNIKGFLCELYSAFQLAYVGGGFRDSVHSLLEPYLAGCQVLTGPKIHKSSEYDFIVESSPERIQLLTKFSWESILECRHGSAINFSSNYSQTEKIMKELLI